MLGCHSVPCPGIYPFQPWLGDFSLHINQYNRIIVYRKLKTTNMNTSSYIAYMISIINGINYVPSPEPDRDYSYFPIRNSKRTARLLNTFFYNGKVYDRPDLDAFLIDGSLLHDEFQARFFARFDYATRNTGRWKFSFKSSLFTVDNLTTISDFELTRRKFNRLVRFQ